MRLSRIASFRASAPAGQARRESPTSARRDPEHRCACMRSACRRFRRSLGSLPSTTHSASARQSLRAGRRGRRTSSRRAHRSRGGKTCSGTGRQIEACQSSRSERPRTNIRRKVCQPSLPYASSTMSASGGVPRMRARRNCVPVRILPRTNPRYRFHVCLCRTIRAQGDDIRASATSECGAGTRRAMIA